MGSKTETTKLQEVQPQESTSSESSSPAATGHLEELHAQAELAHRNYLQAQRKVVSAYREKEQHDVAAYKDIEIEARKVCDAAIKRALVKRTEREQKAAEAYQREREEAARIYEQELMQALSLAREATEQAWEKSRETSEQIWKIFQGNTAQGKH